MIDVHFEDSSTKKFFIYEEMTVGDLVRKVELKMSLKHDLDSFALFLQKKVDGKTYGLFCM